VITDDAKMLRSTKTYVCTVRKKVNEILGGLAERVLYIFINNASRQLKRRANKYFSRENDFPCTCRAKRKSNGSRPK
jgi:hypothetical protein